tara:strand:- start:1190 stop:1303 length:114 start_codon:yes stop_codon:yes gene_type:complete
MAGPTSIDIAAKAFSALQEARTELFNMSSDLGVQTKI